MSPSVSARIKKLFCHKFYVFFITNYFYFIVNATVAPICWKRLTKERGYREKTDNNISSDNQSTTLGASGGFAKWRRFLLHPRDVYYLVKRQQDLSAKQMLLLMVHVVCLLHFSVKSVLIISWQPISDDFGAYLASIYYPSVLHRIRGKILLLYMWSVWTLYTLLTRLCFIGRLISDALDNETRYVKLRPTQLVIAYSTIFKTNLLGLFRLIAVSRKHRLDIKTDPRKMKIHCKCNLINLRQIQLSQPLDQTNQFDRRYYLNMIDFTGCFRGLEHHFETSHDIGLYGHLHRPRPSHRCDLADVSYLLLGVLIATPLLITVYIVWLPLTGYICYYYSVSTPANVQNSNSFDWKSFFNHWKRTENLFEFFELIIIAALTLPIHLESGLLYFTSNLVASRARKVRDMLELELNALRNAKVKLIELRALLYDNNNNNNNKSDKPNNNTPRSAVVKHVTTIPQNVINNARPGPMPTQLRLPIRGRYCSTANRRQIKQSRFSLDTENRFFEPWIVELVQDAQTSQIVSLCIDRKSIDTVNSLLMIYIRLAHLLLDELVDIKSDWTFFMDLVFITNAFTLSIVIIYAYNTSYTSETILIMTLALNSTLPLGLTLLAGTIGEQSLRQIYPRVTSILVNELGLLRLETLRMGLGLNSRLREVENRSFIVGHYLTLSPGGLLKLLIYIPTLLLVLSRTLTVNQRQTT